MPAFGWPTRAASASSLRWSSTSASSPGIPTSAKRGVWRVGVANCLLPRPASAAARDDDPGAGTGEVGDQLAGVVAHLRPDGHVQLDVSPGSPVAARAAAVTTLAGGDRATRAECREVAEIRVGDEDDRAAGAAVAAVGTAPRDVLLTAEAERAVAAAAGDDVDAGTVVEHRSQCVSDAAGDRRCDRVAPAERVHGHARVGVSRPRDLRPAACEPRPAPRRRRWSGRHATARAA